MGNGLIGKTISHYKIIEKLGAGGMGVVYKARDTKLNRYVALKFLPADWTQHEDANVRFLQEARAASALDHNNICTIHEFNQTDNGRMYIVMACYEGESLQKKLESGPLSVEESLNIALQTARGLSRAHSKGIVHRDIKPANILVTNDNIVKIVDFGLAKLADRTKITKEGTTLGTAAYMSPEQVQGSGVTHQTDIWSFGVLLYEMLTGDLPFKGEYEQAVIYSILHEEPESILEKQEDLPESFEQVIDHALQKDTADRYQTMDQVIDDLASISSGAEVSQTPGQTPGFNRGVMYAAGVLACILLIMLGYTYFTNVQPTIDSIAVLPLANLSGDPDQEYFTDGMTEALITDLGKIQSLRVISRQSVMRYKDSDLPINEIADQLNVHAIVEGSALQNDQIVRITAKLINAENENQIWNKRYDRKIEDVLSLQSEVAHAIAREIQIALSLEDQNRLKNTRNVDPDALDAYFKGKYYSREWTLSGQLAIQQFNRAIEIDPDFALAYTGLAYAYLTSAHIVTPPHEAFPKAIEAAEQALRIDPNLAEAETVLADCRYHYEWNWTATEEGFRNAMRLNPGYSTSYLWYSGYLATMKRFDEALGQVKKAQQLDPLALNMFGFEARIHFYARDFDRAIETGLATMEKNPDFLPAHYWLGRSYLEKGMLTEAVETLEQAHERFNGNPLVQSALAQAHAGAGNETRAYQLIEDLQAKFEKRYFPPHLLVMAYADAGDTEHALQWLDKTEQLRDAALIWVTVDPGYDPLRGDQRFTALLDRMNL